MMKKLRESVEALITEELARANKDFPLFRSDHEGVAVIEEEVVETLIDSDSVSDAFEELKASVFTDESYENKQICAKDIAMIATELACEAIQVAAMGVKFNGSMSFRKEREDESSNTDWESDERPGAEVSEHIERAEG